MGVFSSSLSLPQLIDLCHALRIQLGAGLTLRDVFRRMAERSPTGLRPLAQRVGERLQRGESFQAALQPEERLFPPLFIAMTGVGEETGSLAEVFHELEKYYRLQLTYRRQVRAKSVGPIVQFCVALLVVALLIWILDVIGASRGGQRASVLGLRGASGAFQFLLGNALFCATVIFVYKFFTGKMGKKAGIDAMVWRTPMLGPCVRALVMGRFALAMQLTLDSAIPVAKAIRLSLQATGNAAFALQGDDMEVAIREGCELREALGRGAMMPATFIEMVGVGEEGGRLVEIMRHQAAAYQEEAGFRMQSLSRFISGAVWTSYAVFMTFMIFTLYRMYFAAMGL
jgi:type II secretory pathway component PulF